MRIRPGSGLPLQRTARNGRLGDEAVAIVRTARARVAPPPPQKPLTSAKALGHTPRPCRPPPPHDGHSVPHGFAP